MCAAAIGDDLGFVEEGFQHGRASARNRGMTGRVRRMQRAAFRALWARGLCLQHSKQEEETMTSAYSLGRYFQPAASLLLTAGLLVCLATPGSAQYTVTNLVSNQNAIGSNPADPGLQR